MRLREASRSGDTDYLREGLQDPQLRWAAAGFLADSLCFDAAPEIASMLHAPDESARGAAIRALGRLGAGDYLNEIWQSARSEESPMVRSRATVALGQLGGERERDYLVALLDDTDFAIRRDAAWALGQLGDRTVIGPNRASSATGKAA